MAIFPTKSEMDIPVLCLYPDGKKSYVDKINGHFILDVTPEMCYSECSCDDYVFGQRRSNNKQRCRPPPTRKKYHLDEPDSSWISPSKRLAQPRNIK